MSVKREFLLRFLKYFLLFFIFSFITLKLLFNSETTSAQETTRLKVSEGAITDKCGHVTLGPPSGNYNPQTSTLTFTVPIKNNRNYSLNKVRLRWETYYCRDGNMENCDQNRQTVEEDIRLFAREKKVLQTTVKQVLGNNCGSLNLGVSVLNINKDTSCRTLGDWKDAIWGFYNTGKDCGGTLTPPSGQHPSCTNLEGGGLVLQGSKISFLAHPEGSTCTAGTSNTACGTGGVSCMDCAAQGKTCVNGTCYTPQTCSGGCWKGSTCTAGTSNTACGTGGVSCMDCAAQGKTCVNGTCYTPQTCSGGCWIGQNLDRVEFWLISEENINKHGLCSPSEWTPKIWTLIDKDIDGRDGWSAQWNTKYYPEGKYFIAANVYSVYGDENWWCTGNPKGPCNKDPKGVSCPKCSTWVTLKTSSVTPTPTPLRQSPTPTCDKSRGDANCDGKTDKTDFENWRKEYLGGTGTKTADFNNDGRVDMADFETWRKGFFAPPPTSPPGQPTSPPGQPTTTPRPTVTKAPGATATPIPTVTVKPTATTTPKPTACTSGCWNGSACVSGTSATACGSGGSNCTSCDDGNSCTTDSCDSSTGSCRNVTIPGCGLNPTATTTPKPTATPPPECYIDDDCRSPEECINGKCVLPENPTPTPTKKPSATCGNGTTEPGEECDGTDQECNWQAGETCVNCKCVYH